MFDQVLDGEVSAYMKVDKADGRTLYYKVVNNEHKEITKEEFEKETQ